MGGLFSRPIPQAPELTAIYIRLCNKYLLKSSVCQILLDAGGGAKINKAMEMLSIYWGAWENQEGGFNPVCCGGGGGGRKGFSLHYQWRLSEGCLMTISFHLLFDI